MPIDLLKSMKTRIDPANRLATDNAAIDRQIMTNCCCQFETQSKESNNLVCINSCSTFPWPALFLSLTIITTNGIDLHLSTAKFISLRTVTQWLSFLWPYIEEHLSFLTRYSIWVL